jgi:hypothetical protein
VNRGTRTAVAALAADAIGVVAFVTLGRRNHDAATSVDGIATTAAPFLVALVVAWGALRVWRRPLDPRVGAIVVGVTVALGMILRRVVWNGGTAASFVIVTALVLGALLIGWRFAALMVRRRTGPSVR